jgi:hypothetical protein
MSFYLFLLSKMEWYKSPMLPLTSLYDPHNLHWADEGNNESSQREREVEHQRLQTQIELDQSLLSQLGTSRERFRRNLQSQFLDVGVKRYEIPTEPDWVYFDAKMDKVENLRFPPDESPNPFGSHLLPRAQAELDLPVAPAPPPPPRPVRVPAPVDIPEEEIPDPIVIFDIPQEEIERRIAELERDYEEMNAHLQERRGRLPDTEHAREVYDRQVNNLRALRERIDRARRLLRR